MSALLSAEPDRQRAAILFADIHGYSRLMNKDELGTYERVTRSIALIETLIDDYGGRVVQTAGDGVLALFEDACEALKFAVEMQREFRNDGVWNADGDAIAFRIGINEGEVLIGEHGIHGHDVNIAARIQMIAKPGGICISAAVHDIVRDSTDLSMQTLGAKRLRNITDPVEVFAVIVNGGRRTQAIEVTAPLEQAVLEPDQVSVVVLPLEGLSDDPRDHHLCEGITGDIITNLSRFRDLAIIAHHSARIIKLNNLPSTQLWEQLGIRYLMSGDLQRQGVKIRLRVELIDAKSQNIIWSDRFSGNLGDIFGFQNEVTDVVAARLALQIAEAERRRQAQLQTHDIRAYGLILRGQDLSNQFQREANFHARRLFTQAAEIDPSYGRSYAALSKTFNLEWRYAWSEKPERALDTAIELAKRAIEFDGWDARAHGALGYAHLYRKEHDESLAAYTRALELNPNDADLLVEMADALIHTGDPDEAVKLVERSLRLNPYFPDWYLWSLGEAHFYGRRFEEAVETLKGMRDQSEAHRLLASSYAHLDQLEEARHHAAEVLKAHPNFSLEYWAKVPPNRNTEQNEFFIAGLRKAGLK